MPNTYYGWRRGIAVAGRERGGPGGASLIDAQYTVSRAHYRGFYRVVVNTETARAQRGGAGGSRPRDHRAMVHRRGAPGARPGFRAEGGGRIALRSPETERLGTLRTSISRSWDLHYAVQVPTAERRAAHHRRHRPPGQLLGGQRDEKTGYPFTLIELRLDKEDKGDGRMRSPPRSAAARTASRSARALPEANGLQDVHKQKDST